jgi:hypothetical protein
MAHVHQSRELLSRNFPMIDLLPPVAGFAMGMLTALVLIVAMGGHDR